MTDYDVILIGAGPSGLHCARRLARAGRRVLVVERFDDFHQNNFSSAGTTADTLSRFDLPEEIVGSRWNQLTVHSTRVSKTWTSPEILGYILDFSKLRNFLAGEIKRCGSDILMSHSFQDVEIHNGEVRVSLENIHSKEKKHCRARVLVDSTGHRRAVMERLVKSRTRYMNGSGLEYLIEVPEKKFSGNEMVFFLGQKWMPCGYSWIFPMRPYQLKVGAGYYLDGKKLPHPLKYYVEMLLRDHLKTTDYKVLDIHGGMLSYSLGRKDIHHTRNVIAIGDAVSAVNPLGGEGIRHGMTSADVAAQNILDYLDSKVSDFSNYEKQIRSHFDQKWNVCKRISAVFYYFLKDRYIDHSLRLLAQFPVNDVMDMLFHYKFKKMGLRSVVKVATRFTR